MARILPEWVTLTEAPDVQCVKRVSPLPAVTTQAMRRAQVSSPDRLLCSYSRHLAVLREAGLVVTERHGQEIRYELNTSVFQDLIQHLVEWTRPTSGASRRIRKPARTRHQEA
jgi:hypothetical protein